MEDRIKKLCSEFVAEKNPEKSRELSGQLRAELHQFVEILRAKVTQYPIIEERRVQGGITMVEAAPAATVPKS